MQDATAVSTATPTALTPTTPAPFTQAQAQNQDELLTVTEVASLLKCKESSIYNLTRKRGQVRYENPLPVIRAPFGLRFRRSSVLAWMNKQETSASAKLTAKGGVQ